MGIIRMAEAIASRCFRKVGYVKYASAYPIKSLKWQEVIIVSKVAHG